MYHHRSVSLSNEKICCEISEDKIAVCEKTAVLWRGNFSELNSAYSKVLVPVKIFQIACVQAQGKNSGPASKTRYFVLSAFAHERSILIGCLLLDSIIRSVIHHKGSR